jgi:hypothetical protein
MREKQMLTNSKTDVVVARKPVGDLILAIVDNLYFYKHRGVPKTPFLLITQALDEQDRVWMTRIVGISKQAKLCFEQQGIHFFPTDAYLESCIDDYFEKSWAQLWTVSYGEARVTPLSTLIQ